jgi:hypothetical protein
MLRTRILFTIVIMVLSTTGVLKLHGQELRRDESLGVPSQGSYAINDVKEKTAQTTGASSQGKLVLSSAKTQKPPAFPTLPKQQRTYLSEKAKAALIIAAIAGVIVLSVALRKDSGGRGIIGPRF